MTQTVNALTIDIEYYYQAFEMRNIPMDENKKSHRDSGTEKILNILAKRNIKATFFINGAFAEKNRNLIKEICDQDHEIGLHSYTHRKTSELSPEEFSEEIKKSKEIIEGIAKKPVFGFRAPAFSFDENNPSLSQVLMDNGLLYDSSTNPISKIMHGHPGHDFSFHKVFLEKGHFMEFPLATLPILGKRLPWAGGFYLRLFPYIIFKKGLRHINKTEGPAVIYLHNWELDPDQPRIKCNPLLHFIHYHGLSGMEKKLERLTRDFKFAPLKEFL